MFKSKKNVRFSNTILFNVIVFSLFFLIAFVGCIQLYLNNMALGNADLIQFFSSKKYYANSLLNGEFPIWNKYLAAGMPQIGVDSLYLPSILLSFLPLKEFMYVYYILHLAFGAMFFYLFLKELNCSKQVAFVMAIIYETSIHISGLRKGHMALITAICLLPIIMYFIMKYFNNNENKWLFLSTIPMALQMAACQQYAIYTDIMLILFLLIYGKHLKMKWLKMIKAGIVWGVLYIILSSFVLLPTMALMNEYGIAGSTKISYEYFSSYSIHFIKLIQMLFPNFFGEEYQFLGSYYSSEMDIELFIGVFLLFIIVIGLFKYIKNFEIKFCTIFCIIAFCYSAIAHIPILNKIVFHLPVLGNFRCTARALFLFIFFTFTLVAIILNEICRKENLYNFCYILLKVSISAFTIISIAVIILVFNICLTNTDTIVIKSSFSRIGSTFFPSLFVLIVMIILSFFVLKQYKLLNKNIASYKIFLSVLLLTTLLETSKYRNISTPVSFDSFNVDDEIIQLIKNDKTYKTWDAFSSIDGNHYSPISQNISVIKEIPSINAYTAYNNPYLYKLFSKNKISPSNSSGLLTGSFDAKYNLKCQNDMLSMLGIKYIIDSSNLLIADSTIIGDKAIKEVFYQKTLNIIKNDELTVYEIPIELESNTEYKISFEVKNMESKYFNIDFYGGSTYDSPNQELSFELKKDQDKYIGYINSMDTSIANEKIRLRLLSISDNNILLSNFKVETYETVTAYNYVGVCEGIYNVYENINAKELLYFPKKTEHIYDFEYLYQDTLNYDLSNISYILQDNIKYENNLNSSIEIKKNGINNLISEISVEKDSFVNFSQSFHKGWKAYIDKKEVPIYMVNGVIMGIEVPKGVHLVEFRYTSNWTLIGSIISFIGLIFILSYCVLDIRKKKLAYFIKN